MDCRLENRNDELLERSEDTGTLIESVDVVTGDRIASLNKQISIETEKIQETRQRLDALTKSREEAKEAHVRNVDAANEKYENKRIDLTSAIKALSTPNIFFSMNNEIHYMEKLKKINKKIIVDAKINTLEDYKETRAGLREKLRVLDETMTRNKEKVRQRRDEIDRKFKIDREKCVDHTLCSVVLFFKLFLLVQTEK